MLLVDTPGFQNPRLAQQQRGATYEELCHNYTQERLQTLFHQRTFVREMERYKEVATHTHTLSTFDPELVSRCDFCSCPAEAVTTVTADTCPARSRGFPGGVNRFGRLQLPVRSLRVPPGRPNPIRADCW